VLLRERLERLAIRRALEESARADVVDARDHRVAERARELLGLVLRAGLAHHARRRTHEPDARLLDRRDERGVLGHEAVAREDVGVAVRDCDLDDLADPLLLLRLPDAHVVGHAVHVLREAEAAQLGREAARIGDRVLLREQHPVLADADRVEDLERLEPDRPAAHDQALDRRRVERADPDRVALGVGAAHEVAAAHYSNSRCGPLIAEGL
jgi:hypothetical protein